MSRRLEQMKALVASHPDNPMAWYSLALEQKKTDIPAALATFASLLEKHPSYVPAYYHYGQTLVSAGEDDRAKEIYNRGIALANQAGDAHAASELAGALELL
jgi:predicted Zn-dependent protease